MRNVRNVVICLLLSIPLFCLSACKRRLISPVLDPRSLTILCLGDSITAGTHSEGDDGEQSYPGILAGFLQEYRPNVQVVNEGQNGWTVSDVAANLATFLQPQTPNIILLQIGTNDLEQGIPPSVAAEKLDLLVTQIQLLAPTSHLYLASCTPVRYDNRPNLAIPTLEKFNEFIPKIVKEHEHRGSFIVFVDLYKRADLTDVDFGPDGEHPNDAGYEKLAEYWSWELQRREMVDPKISSFDRSQSLADE